MILIAYIILTALAAITDALFFEGNKSASKLVESAFQIGIFFVPILYKKNFDFWYLFSCGLAYLFVRMAIFDPIFNLFAHLDINYIGTTTPVYDDIMDKLSYIFIWFYRVFMMGLAVLIYFKKIKPLNGGS